MVIVLGIIVGFAVIVAIHLTILCNIHLLAKLWERVALGLVLTGLVVGIWLGFAFEYQAADDLRIRGWPFPIIVFQLEGGRWVDYVGLIPIIGPLNTLIVETAFVLPVFVAVVAALLCCQRDSAPHT